MKISWTMEKIEQTFTVMIRKRKTTAEEIGTSTRMNFANRVNEYVGDTRKSVISSIPEPDEWPKPSR